MPETKPIFRVNGDAGMLAGKRVHDGRPFNGFGVRKPFSIEKNHTLWQSTVSAARGFADAIRSERKIRQIFLWMAAVSVVCAFADVGYFQILIVIFSWVVALICETFNTALEKALDYAGGSEYHPLIGQGKDYASACTFVSLLFAGSLTLFVFFDRIF